MSSTDVPRTRRILTEIDPASWEHPADRAALQAVRRIPVFDQVLRVVFGIFGERAIRLAFQSNAVKAGPNQYPRLYGHYKEVLKTLDAEEEYPLFVSQTPLVNAGAYGMDHPFIVLNSGALVLLDDDELTYLMGHELGHIMSGHVLYRTMIILLTQLASLGFPIVGLAARAVLVALLEWQRKAELSCDRAGLLTVQHPEAVMRSFMKLAGSSEDLVRDDMNLDQFMIQAEEYRDGGDAVDIVFKVLNLLGATHPFHVLRAAETRDWIQAGEYDRILRGEYRRRGDERAPWKDDLAAASRAYREDATNLSKQFGDALRDLREKMASGFARGA